MDSFFWEPILPSASLGGSFPWQPPRYTSGISMKWLPKPRGPHGVLLSPRYPAKDMEKHWAERALTLSLAGEASPAVTVPGAPTGLLQKLTALADACGGRL